MYIIPFPPSIHPKSDDGPEFRKVASDTKQALVNGLAADTHLPGQGDSGPRLVGDDLGE